MTAPLDTIAGRAREIDLASRRDRWTGVYFLISNGEIVYVGASTDVEMRIAQHIVESNRPTTTRRGKRQPNPLYKEFDRALWFPVPRITLTLYEGALIRAINPRYCFGAQGDESRDREILARIGLAPNDVAHAAFKAKRATRWPASSERSQTMREVWRRKQDWKRREAQAEKRRIRKLRRAAAVAPTADLPLDAKAS